MSVASSSPSFPCIKLHNPSSPTPSSCSSYPPSSSSPAFKFTIRSSQADGPLRRPVVSSPLKPVPPSPLPTASPPASSPPPSAPLKQVGLVIGGVGVTLEFQRQKAKELQEYFKKKKLEEANQGPAFGFVGKNEISNGRWAMFGFAVGMLTEYATGSDFVDQVKILLSNFGIVDIE